MGVSIEQYRLSIGLFNSCKFGKTSMNFDTFLCSALLQFITFLFILLLLMANDIELHPGPNRHNLGLCHINIRSLQKNMTALQTFVNDSVDIITLSETFLRDSIDYNLLSVDGFKRLEHRNRTDQFGGGVGLYVRNNIMCYRRKEYELPDIEAMWHEIRVGSTSMLLCTCYRPPNSGIVFWDKLGDCISMAQNTNTSNLIIIGDLNSDPSTTSGKKLNEFTVSHNLHINVHEATRYTATGSSILDQVLSSSQHVVNNITIEPPIGTNDHCTVVASLRLKPKIDPPYNRTIWNYSKADISGLKRHLAQADWDACFSSEDVNCIACSWTETLLNGARMFIPNRTITVRPKDKPWYTNELRTIKRKVLRLFHIAKRSNNPTKWEAYRTLNGEYHELIVEAKLRHERQEMKKLQLIPQNPKFWWRKVKHILGYGQCGTIPPIKLNGIILEDSLSKSEKFNAAFLAHNKIDVSNATLPDNHPNSNVEISDLDITVQDVREVLKTLDTNKSLGPDGVSPTLLKMCASEIAPSLTKLFNCSIKYGKFPDKWKLANVVPLFKKGDAHLIDNYRPVSLLSCVSKVFEKIIFKYVFNFLRDNLKITIHQSGFIPGDSTTNQLVYLYNFFAKALDEKKEVYIVFCDISKAFDRVWHDGLIYKLKRVGINGILLDWFKNYLTDRKQRVTINGQSSSWGKICAGVPQGSVLGPLLFIVYINDIVENIGSNIKLFADDTAIYIDVEKTEEGEIMLNRDLDTLDKWSKQWLVSFNIKKTKAMNISLKCNKSNPNLIFQNESLHIDDNHKHLGIMLDNRLSWNTHIQSIANRAMKHIDVMKRLRWKLDRNTLEIIYKSYVRPVMEYGCVIWNNCSNENVEILENIQLEAARIVTGAIRNTWHDNLYEETGWEKLSDRRKRQNLLLFHKMFYGTAPTYLQELVPSFVGENNPYSTRYANNLSGIDSRLKLYEKSFLPSVVEEWNVLPPAIRNIENYKLFKATINKKPSTTNKNYYLGERSENVILARIRMECSALKAHLHKLHVISDPSCPCQTGRETSRHYFFKCPLYIHQRTKLIDDLKEKMHIHIDDSKLNILLYGNHRLGEKANKRIVEHVHIFIRDTKRFLK